MAEIALQNENDELRLALGKVEEMLKQSQRKCFYFKVIIRFQY